MGVYNLLLAIGLGWAGMVDANIGRLLATFFAIWLLAAAAAALYTRVIKACVAQWALGLLLLVASIWA